MLRSDPHAFVRAASMARRLRWQLGLVALLAMVCSFAVRERLNSAVVHRVMACASQSTDQHQSPGPDSEVPLPVDESPQAESDWGFAGGMDQLLAPQLLGCKPLTAAHPCHWGPCYCATPKQLLHSLQQLQI